VILPGFLLSARRSYRSLAAHLASYGVAAALVDADDPAASDMATARAVAAAAAACASRARAAASGGGGGGAKPLPPVVLIGHSRGAKIAALAAGGWDRLAPRGNGSVGPRAPPPLAGLVLLDPVDRATLGPPPGPSYPSCLPFVSILAGGGGAQSRSKGVPILIVGAGDNADIVEPSAGWQAFGAAAAQGAQQAARAGGGGGAPSSSSSSSSSSSIVAELLLPRAKHLDFADTQSDPFVGGILGLAGSILGGSAAGGGSGPDAAAVRRCADAAAAYWVHEVCCCSPPRRGDEVAGGGGGGAAAFEREAAELRRALVPDARWKVVAWGVGGGGGGGGDDGVGGGVGGGAGGGDSALLSRERLKSMRASQLQALLRERGVYYGDCFDKAALVERALAGRGGGGGGG
jgi:hypothetical protein